MPQSTLISYINITYTLEVEVSEVLEHTKKQYVYIYISIYKCDIKIFRGTNYLCFFFYFYICLQI